MEFMQDIPELTIEQKFDSNGMEIKEPLTNSDYIKGILYLNKMNEERHDEKMYEICKIKFWLKVIGIYFLAKIIIAVSIFLFKFTAIMNLIKILENLQLR